jgi:hypothetical protein
LTPVNYRLDRRVCLSFLPPAAQDLLLDNVTALSATGSRPRAAITNLTITT